MKKYLSIITFTIGLVSISSCKKMLDTHPQAVVSVANYFQNDSQVNSYVASMYDFLGKNAFLYQNQIQNGFNSGTDETYNRSGTGAANIFHYSASSGDANIIGLFSDIYTGVDRCNIVLENIDRAVGITDTKRRNVKGEAKFMRAFWHFLATQWYGDIPLRTKSFQTPDETNIAFTPTKQVYDWIISEMTEAEALLETQKATDLTPFYTERVTYTTVQGILARVCLYAAGSPVNDVSRYAEARKWALKAMGSNIHSLNPNYDQVFINESADLYDGVNKEIMWEVGFSGPTVVGGSTSLREQISTNPMIAIQNPNGTITGRVTCNIQPTALLYRAYESYYNAAASSDDSPDLRRDINVAPYQFSGGNTTTGVEPTKVAWTFGQNNFWLRWPGKWRRENEPVNKDNGLSGQNWPLLRYSDVLLMFAEADNYVNGPTPEAVEAVNKVRRRGYGALLGNNPVLLTLANQGTGYTVAPTATTVIGGTGTVDPTISSTLGTGATAGKVIAIGQGKLGRYSALPTAIYLGTPWKAATAFAVNTNVVVATNATDGRLYRVTTAGTTTSTAPTNTSGASTAATTGAVFTYIGTPATATASIISADLTADKFTNKDVFLATIQQERSRELCYEGFRRQDLKRWGILIQMVQLRRDYAQNGSPDLIPGTTVQRVQPIPSASLAVGTEDGNNISGKWVLLPIPISELANNNLAKQNPGFN